MTGVRQWMRRGAGRRGSALIVMYWIIALLTLLVFGGAQVVFSEFSMQAVQGERARAHQLAEMGLAIAAHPLMERDDPALIREVSERESFAATIESENARLNLNAILASGDRIVLERLFEGWGMRPEEASPVISALGDWVDSDDLVTLGGAEEDDYLRAGILGAPPNRAFLTLAETAGVWGIGRLAEARPDWRDYFTLFGNGLLALDDAGPEAISAACACSLDAAQSFVELRRGRDGLENTEDDVVFTSVEEAMNLLDVAAVERGGVATRVTVQGSTLRLRSLGEVGDIRVERWLVVEGRGPGMRVLAAGSRAMPSSPKR